MNTEEQYMNRCIELAKQGLGYVQPNPMVGCVIVHENKIIGEGYHKKFGDAHAEVNAINSVRKQHTAFLPKSTLYVNLEPCAHHGKTPPCTDMILRHGIKNIVIGSADSNPLVEGKGIELLKKNDCNVKIAILEKESLELNKRFFTFFEKKRPYIILKWAQTTDGFIGMQNFKFQISNFKSQILLHKWRSEEQAIMVGTNTATIDNPQLNVRLWKGKNPLRIVIDKSLKLPLELNLFDTSQPTLVFTSCKKKSADNLGYIQIDFEKNIIPQILSELYKKNIQSLLVEGGSRLLNSFIENDMWDETRVFIAKKIFGNGVKAPDIPGALYSKKNIGEDELAVTKYESDSEY